MDITSTSVLEFQRWLPITFRKELMLNSNRKNGILGMGPFPFDGEEDADLINAGKQTITARAGAVYLIQLQALL